MIVRVLYFDGCPNHLPAVELAKSVVKEIGVDATVEEVEVQGQEDAEALRFFGSPTIQVDGVDIDPEARERSDYSFSCRMYGASGLPTRELMKAALFGDQGAKSNATLVASVGSIVAAVVASACCWLPPLLLLGGVSAAGVATAFANVRPWFLGGAFALLGLGFYLNYGRKPVCAPGSSCGTPTSKLVRFNRAMLWMALVGVLSFAFLPKYLGLAAGDGTTVLSPDAPKVTLAIEGMTCEACAVGVQTSLRRVAGVSDASVSYSESKAVVAIDEASPAETNQLVEAVEENGFRVADVR